MTNAQPTYFEFFAGGGMARAGLAPSWRCLFANDFDEMKVRTYSANWGSGDILCEDVAKLRPSHLPESADLVWASFPCQDLSLAGDYRGLGGEDAAVMTRSGTFWPFWSLMRSLRKEGRAPKAIVLENVIGVLTSRKGQDFSAICSALSSGGYRVGVVVVDAAHFVPQSRQRVFFIAVDAATHVPPQMLASAPSRTWHPPRLVAAQASLNASSKGNWLWWKLPKPIERQVKLAAIIEDQPTDVRWHSAAETERLLAMMAPLHRDKVEAAKLACHRVVGCIYKRTRADGAGIKRQRAEVRFDGVAGCLRTPGGGSSKQTIIVVEGHAVRSRLLSPREAARLMGLNDDYVLPERLSDSYHVTGDGVCVPVVRFIAANLLEPIVAKQDRRCMSKAG